MKNGKEKKEACRYLHTEWALFQTNRGWITVLVILTVAYAFLVPFSALTGVAQVITAGGGSALFLVAYLPFFVTLEKRQFVSVEEKLLCHAMTKRQYLKDRFVIFWILLFALSALLLLLSLPEKLICREAFRFSMLLCELLGLWFCAFCYAISMFSLSPSLMATIVPGLAGFLAGFISGLTSFGKLTQIGRKELLVQGSLTGAAMAVFFAIYAVRLLRPRVGNRRREK